MKASDLVLKCLEMQGITTMFGVPGEENDDIMMSLPKSSIEFITTRHEQTASFMATMHGALTGKPGVCLATLGPGACNLITGVGQANMDNAPLIAIIGQAETGRLHKTSHQNMDSVDMYKPVTKWATTIRDADVIPEVIAKAYKVATTGVPGAVLIELPEDIAKQETKAKPFKATVKRLDMGVSDKRVKEVIDLLAASKKPILLLGDGAVRENCHKELKAFLDKTKLYSAYTFMGKGAISNLYERSLHCVGLGMKDQVVKAFEVSDLVICIGYDMVEYPPARWNAGKPKKIIHINVEPAEVDQYYVPEFEMVGDLNAILHLINDRLTPQCEKATPYLADVQKIIRADVRSDADDAGFPMKPKRILRDIRETLADEDILVSDVGAHKMWVARQYGGRLPKTCFISNGFCSMGGSIPGALEAKRLYPKKNVVAVCGDGGFMMSIQALNTGVEHKIPIVIVLWQDNAYGLIKWKQQMAFNAFSHVDLVNPDLARLAEGFGCHGVSIKATDEFVPAFKKALTVKDRPTVIVVPVDYSENMKLFHHLKEAVR